MGTHITTRRDIERRATIDRRNARAFKHAQCEIALLIAPRHRDISREELDDIARDLIPWDTTRERKFF